MNHSLSRSNASKSYTAPKSACATNVAYRRLACLQVPPQRLLTLQRLEQRLEISLAEAAAALALDHLEEQRRAVFHRAREDLEHIALVVAIHQNAQLFELIQGLVDLANARGKIAIV